jgi:glycosyltransferase involved in cell wall biosynthesis
MRRSVALPPEKLRTRLLIEVLGALLHKSGLSKEYGWRIRNRLFQKLVPQNEILEADVVVGFDTASDILAERCRRAGRRLVLDQTTPARSFKARIFRELGIFTSETNRHASVEQGEKREQAGATKIIVASTFCRESFSENSAIQKKTVVIPYGFESGFLSIGRSREYSQLSKRTRFLYVGNLGRHKGVETLKEAWVKLRSMSANLQVVGAGSQATHRELRKMGVETHGQMSLEGVAKEMAAADVFVFPSYFEGFGRVILEAMAAGLPVITTLNTGGPDVILQGKEGLLVPAGDAAQLGQALASMVQNPAGAVEMGRRAHARAAQLTWAEYGKNYVRMLQTL